MVYTETTTTTKKPDGTKRLQLQQRSLMVQKETTTTKKPDEYYRDYN